LKKVLEVSEKGRSFAARFEEKREGKEEKKLAKSFGNKKKLSQFCSPLREEHKGKRGEKSSRTPKSSLTSWTQQQRNPEGIDKWEDI